MNERSSSQDQKEAHYIVWPGQASWHDARRLGGKASNLFKLIEAGFPVPTCFCICTNAFEEARKQSGETIPQRIPEIIWRQVIQAYEKLITGHGKPLRVAVRSSATNEDLDNASYAGQYHSILNVSTIEDLHTAVLACWASLASPPVQAYQRSRPTITNELSMAVIVQWMIESEVSGVTFTSNPTTGDRNEVVIEYSRSFLEGVEAGTVTPERLVIKKKKGWGTNPAGKPGNQFTNGTEDAPLRQIAALAEQIENYFHQPQDIEWAAADGQVWILQSRPITVDIPLQERQIWTRANAGEILPSVVTPLSWSVFSSVLRAAGAYRGLHPLALHWRWRHPRGKWPDSPRLFGGRAYMELSAVYSSFASFPGVSAELLRRVLGFEFHLLSPQEFPERLPRWHIMDPYRWSRFWLEMLGITHTFDRARKRFNTLRDHWSQDLGDCDEVTFIKWINNYKKAAAQTLSVHILCTAYTFSALGLLLSLARKYSSDECIQELETILASDYRAMSTAQHILGIWNLAQKVKQTPAAREIIELTESLEDLPAKWQAVNGTDELQQEWANFLKAFGQRSTQEFELSMPRWDEDPGLIFALVKDIVADELPDPGARLASRQDQSKKILLDVTKVIKKNGSPIERWLFGRYCQSFDRLVPLRESLKYEAVCRFAVLRKAYLHQANLFVQKGLLSCEDEIFFLDQEEIKDCIESRGVTINFLAEKIANRKEEQEKFERIKTPPVFSLVGETIIELDKPECEIDGLLKGIACSGGIHSAPAYLLKSLHGKDERMPPGAILVAPSIDPGLTPLFVNASGLVTEIGGLLSHGATLARELGLPAVVAVPDAMSRIKNNEMITVDGYRGLVIIHQKSEKEQV